MQSTTRTIELGPDSTIEVEQGTLVVPERRGDPTSRRLRLAFARLKGPMSGVSPPVVYLPGGPGGAMVARADDNSAVLRWLPALAVADIIFLDQRGTGRSEPDLLYPSGKPLPIDFFLDGESAFAEACTLARAAFAHFTEQGIDLYAYNSEASADDLDDLRRALGEDKLSLLGFSYGTHLALATVRRHGEHIDRVVLVGVEGPNHTLKLPSTYTRQIRTLSALAAKDPAVNEQVPDMEALLAKVLKKLEREPITVSVYDGMTNERRELPIGPFGLQLVLRLDIGDGNDFPVFPRLLHSIDQGDPSLLQWFIAKRYSQFNQGVSAMSNMFDLSSWASAERLARIRAETPECLLGPAVNLGMLETHEAWGAPDLGADFRAPIESDVPLLIFSGTLDSNTPPVQAEEVLSGFTNGTHIVVENAGHEDMLFVNQKVMSTALRFFGGDDVADVRIALPSPRFVPIEGDDPQVTHPSLR